MSILLSCEAEYRSMTNIVCELLWITYILKDSSVNPITPIPLWCDNKSTLHIAVNPVYHKHTEHIEFDYHVVIAIKKDSFNLNAWAYAQLELAALFTKALAPPRLTSLIHPSWVYILTHMLPTWGGGVTIWAHAYHAFSVVNIFRFILLFTLYIKKISSRFFRLLVGSCPSLLDLVFSFSTPRHVVNACGILY